MILDLLAMKKILTEENNIVRPIKKKQTKELKLLQISAHRDAEKLFQKKKI